MSHLPVEQRRDETERDIGYRGTSGVLPIFNMKIIEIFLVILKAIEKNVTYHNYIPMLKATYSLTCFSKSTSICSNLRINLVLPFLCIYLNLSGWVYD